MTRKTVSKAKLRKELSDAAEEAVAESGYLSAEEVEELVDELLDEHLDDEDEDSTAEGVMDTDEKDDQYPMDELKEQLPEDIWEEVKNHLTEPDSAIERAMKSVTGQGPEIPDVESDQPSAEETASAALSRFEHHDDGSPGGE